MPPAALAAALAARSGSAGAGITDEAWLRQDAMLQAARAERVMARDFDRQVAELQIRAAILNRFTALGTLQTQRVGWVRSREGKAASN